MASEVGSGGRGCGADGAFGHEPVFSRDSDSVFQVRELQIASRRIHDRKQN